MDRNSQILAQYSREIALLEKIILDPAFKARVNPLFYAYFDGMVTTVEGIRNYFLHNAVIADYCHIENRTVLDLGCGTGLRAICLAFMGAKKVIGVDISQDMLQCFETLLERLPRLNIEVNKGDFLALDYQPDSQDVVVIVETISHIRDTELLLDRVANIMRNRGILYISDGNNDMFLTSRLRSRRVWKMVENGPLPDELAIYGRECDRLPFFDARIKLIQERFPSLDEATLREVSAKTQGLYGEQITLAAEQFLSTGTTSVKATFPFRNPYTGEFAELGFNPYSLIKELRRRGFQARLVPPTMAHVGTPRGVMELPAWKSAVVEAVLPVLRRVPHLLLPLIYPSFYIVAEKSLRIDQMCPSENARL